MTSQGIMLGLQRAERPEQIGLSSERLDRITATFSADVERSAIPGAMLAIARAGRIGYAEAIGYRDREAGAKLQLDSIFRIASMTKPMVSVAAMQLAEEGKLDIGAPVAQYIPDLASMTVGAERAKAKSAMTVQDLLRHTSDLTYAMFGDSAVQMIWRDANLQVDDQTNDELVAKLAKLPLLFEPGTTWEYQVSGSEADTSKKWTASLPARRSKSRGTLKMPWCYGTNMELAQSSIDEPAASRARPRSWLCHFAEPSGVPLAACARS